MSTPKIVKCLNSLLEADPDAIKNLIDARVICNNNLADHETCQVIEDPVTKETKVGLLGVINAICGNLDGGKIAAVIDEENNIHRFEVII